MHATLQPVSFVPRRAITKSFFILPSQEHFFSPQGALPKPLLGVGAANPPTEKLALLASSFSSVGVGPLEWREVCISVSLKAYVLRHWSEVNMLHGEPSKDKVNSRE